MVRDTTVDALARLTQAGESPRASVAGRSFVSGDIFYHVPNGAEAEVLL